MFGYSLGPLHVGDPFQNDTPTVPKPLRITHPGGSCASKADAVDQNLGEVQRVVSEEDARGSPIIYDISILAG